jgi:pyridoxal phosphate enzyme (YggS family)
MEEASVRLGRNVDRIRERLGAACERAGREPAAVRLVAASKGVAPEAIGWAARVGIEDFGENYVQELRSKRDAAPSATWHYIGTLQSHTAHHVADLADVVQTLVPGKAAARLSRRAVERGRGLRGLIEVDFTGGRAGVAPDDLERFADEVASLDGIDLVGLMTLPPPTPTAEGARPYFARLRELRDRVSASHPRVTELSMGMSLDYEVAVLEGATIVRIGTALFGERSPA